MPTGVADPIEQLLQSTAMPGGELLLCRHCHNPITRSGERIEVGVSHDFRFTNPAGITYHIGCFRNAPGCTLAGEPTEHDSWFNGYRWQIAVCAECQQHLGWYYQNPGLRFFFGLIPDRLVEQPASDDAI